MEKVIVNSLGSILPALSDSVGNLEVQSPVEKLKYSWGHSAPQD